MHGPKLKIFKRPKTREDGSDFDEYRTKKIAATRASWRTLKASGPCPRSASARYGCEKNIVKQNPIKNKPCRIEIISKFSNSGENFDFWWKSRLSAKISTFGENLDFRRKSQLSPKISTFGENLEFRWKSRLSAKISNFGENLDFWRKSRLLVKISTFGENLDFMRHNPQ